MSACHDRGETLIRWNMRGDLEESVQFTPGYACPVTGPHGHGRHGMEIRWLLRGPAGAAQFLLFTCWVPGEVEAPFTSRVPYPGAGSCHSMGADVGYHARIPQFDGHEPMSDECSIIGGICYYDGSGMRAGELFVKFAAEGEQAIWDELESVYADLVATAKESRS